MNRRPTATRASPQGRPAPLVGAAARMGGTCEHDRLRPTRRGNSRPRTHQLATRRPQGAAANRGGGIGRRGGRPLAGWMPVGKGSHRLHRGSSGGTDGARGIRASF
ncbi:hypothetical protein BHE74_00051114 [Ensete ventricosum]|nr:hypothetical protein BHE74_00051114 [Ensete ventricosum]